jgi:tetratricopeptide (TPR) repeat protein
MPHAPLPEEISDPEALAQVEPGLAVELERTEPDTQVGEPAWLLSAPEGAHASALASAAEGAPAHPAEVELAVMEQTPINLAELPVAREVIVQAGETLEQPVVEETALLAAPAPAPQAAAPDPLAAVSEPMRPALVDPRNANAILAYRRVAEINPTNDRAWHVLGNLLSDLGIYDEAVPALERAVSLAPARAVYHYHLGLALAGMKRYEEAIQSFLKTVELNPEHVFAHCSLAGYYRKLGNQAAADRHINIAAPMMKLEKTYNQACFEAISGNNDHALELLEVALEADKTPVDWLRRDPDLDFLREDARFVALIKRYEARG